MNKDFEDLTIAQQAFIVWPELSLREGKRRIRVAIAFNKKYPNGLPDDFGKCQDNAD